MRQFHMEPVLEALEQRTSPILRTWISGVRRGETELLTSFPAPDPACFDERLEQTPHLVVMGAGHVSKALCQVASFCGFRVTVLDQRQELLTRERFPDADGLMQASYESLEPVLPREPVYYVVVTSGHEGDYLCTRAVLNRPFLYAGMIGSRAKVALTRKRLEEDGVAPEVLARLHAPVGLEIGAQTPEEIAVSIMGEMILVKNRVPASTLPADLLAELKKPGCTGVLCTIIQKKGSVPRGVGSKMLVLPDGTIRGTIGGGSVEYLVISHAGELTDFDVQEYGLQPGQNTGMACGGRITVMFQPCGGK